MPSATNQIAMIGPNILPMSAVPPGLHEKKQDKDADRPRDHIVVEAAG